MKRWILIIARWIVLPVALVVLGAILAGSYLIDFAKSANDNADWYDPSTGIDEEGMVEIGGIPQYIHIRGQDTTNPVLLDLHGGPGGAQSGFTYRILRPWTEYFTVVEWDQRGAGRSDDDDPSYVEAMSFERMVADAVEVIEHLKTRLGVHKVILVGHSWGSILGITVAQRRPDLLHAYVGMGQAVAWETGFDETTRLLIEAAEAAGDREIAERLKALPPEWPPADDTEGFMRRIGTIQGVLPRYGKGMHALKDTEAGINALLPEIIGSPDMSFGDLSGMMNKSPATMRLIEDLSGLDLRTDLSLDFDVPLFFFQGEHDWQTPTTLARPYVESLDAPIKEYIPFEHSAHWLITEEPGKILVELVNRVRPLAMSERMAAVVQ
jgi:pimeloyl-ACP methyl ester carboxylesterase